MYCFQMKNLNVEIINKNLRFPEFKNYHRMACLMCFNKKNRFNFKLVQWKLVANTQLKYLTLKIIFN